MSDATASREFVKDIVEHVPLLETLYDTHLAENGSLLPHVFMTELTAFVTDEATRLGNAAALGELLALLEAALGNDGEVDELIGVSFVENLIGEEAALAVLRPLMGPRLRGELDRVSG